MGIAPKKTTAPACCDPSNAQKKISVGISLQMCCQILFNFEYYFSFFYKLNPN